MSSFIPNRQSSVFKPRIISSDSSSMRQEIASSVLPKGASLAVPSSFHQRTASGFFGGNMPMGVSPFGSGGGGGSSMYHMQRPYMPGVESPDRVQYPRTREEANRAWRLFHETDPIFGTAMDMYAEMLVSDFDVIVGDDKSSEIRNTLEYMCQTTNLMDRLRYIIREYLVLGEAIPHCWTPEQSVLTPDGFKRIDTVAEGDLVLTHERRFRPVTEVHVREYSGDVLNFGIEGISALPCRCTPEHPLYVWTEDGPVWKRAKDVTILDHIAVGVDKDVEDIEDFDVSDVVPEYFDLLAENDKHNEHTGREPIPDIVKVDEDFMRLVGYYYSEGNAFVTSRKGRLTFSFHIDEAPYHEDVARIVKAKFGVECRFDMKPDTHTCQIHIDSKIIASFFLNLFGTGCRDKLVPSWLRKLPIHKQKSFLIGLFRGDGNIYYSKVSKFTTAQVQLAHEGVTHLAWQMLLRMDVAASFNIFSRARYGSYWKCSFNAGVYSALAEEIFEEYVEPALIVRKHAQIRHDTLFYRVRSIEREEYEGSVYNLEVEEDHSYVVGGIVSHNCFFDDSLGIWTYIAMHNPDFIEVLDSPIVNMDPIISFIPDESLRSMMSAGTPEAREFRARLPPDFVSRILARQKIRLSPLNCTFIPRKLHPYQTRGTSLASRMWRIFMVEDAVYNSTIATFRRHASPVKVLKLGDPATGWIPAPGAETKLLEMLNRAEVDPHSWLIYHYGINFEQWGTTDKSVTIGKEHDVIERVKLLALGLSKSFMTGEVTYASSLYDSFVRSSDDSTVFLGEVLVGDLVKDRFGDTQKVTNVLKYPSPDKMVKISVYGNRSLTLTDNHFLPVFMRPRTCLCGCGTLLGDERYVAQGHMFWRSFVPGHHKLSERGGRDRVWKEYKHDDKVIVRFPEKHDPHQKLMAAEVIKGDWLMIPRKFEVSDTPATEENLKKARLLGYYVAEGSVRDGATPGANPSATFSFGNEEKELLYAEDVKSCAASLGFDVTVRKEADLCYTAYVPTSSRSLTDWLDVSAHRYSQTKYLSSEVMHWNLDLKKELIKGMFRGDGYIFKGGNGKTTKNRLDIVYVTTSQQLSFQVELILAQLGYASSVHQSEERVDKKGYVHKPCWNISIFGKQAMPLAQFVWGEVPAVWDQFNFDDFDKGSQGERFECFKDDDFLYLPVTKVEIVEVDKERDPFVYSLTVENTESYTLDNIASYNSAKSGLQVFLRRLLSLRQLLENLWIYPKFFRPISEINDWTTASKSEVNHNYRVKRTAQEIQERNMVMVPTLKWKNKLDPTVDTDVLAAYQILEKFGIKLSKATVSSAVGIDWEDELEKSLKEFKTEKEKKEQTLGQTELALYEAEHGKASQTPGGAPPGAPGGPGAGAKPPAATGKPPGAMGAPGAPPGGMNDASNPPGSAEPAVPGALGGGIEGPGGGGLPG